MILAELMQSYADFKFLNGLEGSCKTIVPSVGFYRVSEGSGRQPLLYQSGIIVMGQGHKKIHLGDETVCYGAGDYLVLGVPLPLECEAFSDNGLPIFGLSINIDSKLLHKLVNQLAEDNYLHDTYSNLNSCLDLSIKSESINAELDDTIKRLLLVLHNDTEAKILGPAIVEEIVFRVLTGENGHILFDLARHDGHYARIAKILNLMHREYATPITVEALAEQANMSISGFHRAFRQVTTETPLQYLKKVRLSKAKELIVTEGLRANDAAMQVGYLSPTQFSREFKRHFRTTPRSLLS